MTEENNTPTLRTAEQLNAEELRNYWLDPEQEYPEPHFLIEYNGVGFSPLGGIQAISGQKKNGKTFVLAQLMVEVAARYHYCLIPMLLLMAAPVLQGRKTERRT